MTAAADGRVTSTDAPGGIAPADVLGTSAATLTSPDSSTPILVSEPRKVLAAAPPGRARLAHPQPERHVVQRGHVGEQAVALEHHAHVPPGRLDPGDVPVVDDHRPAVGGLEPGYDAQRRGLAAPGRTEQADELAGGDLQ
jgi:hypothetical protein